MTDIESPRSSALRPRDAPPSIPRELRAAPGVTVCDAIAETVLRLGWTRGRAVARSGSVDLLRAIDLTVDPEGPSGGVDVARAARIRNHLAELLPSSSLTGWNDAPGRALAEIQELLSLAAEEYPLD